ncbi:MAG: hypothetical protein KDD69_16470 [Bdellovibrionales bacterium]|nr:hypothetical protein [Bdellovibrionales bacterium]
MGRHHNPHESSEFKRHFESKIPERKLLLAVLKRAVLDFLSADQSTRAEASDWIFRDDGKQQFTISWICEQLELDRDQLLKQIKQLSADRQRAGLTLSAELRHLN